jgi:ring-1,2-phenylacetyl-CoA epoxidase subunit PaaD
MVGGQAGRRTGGPPPGASAVLDVLGGVMDPEVPVLNIVELGIVRGAEVSGDTVQVEVTPTYSGCPAMRVIEEEIVAALRRHGFRQVEVRTVFQPAWTTDWMTDEAREKLRAYGIAPPGPAEPEDTPLRLGPTVRRVPCPFCGSSNTELRSAFGATACKALHSCNACHQPFEQFKAH